MRGQERQRNKKQLILEVQMPRLQAARKSEEPGKPTLIKTDLLIYQGFFLIFP
jgi:hypothetical protein